MNFRTRFVPFIREAGSRTRTRPTTSAALPGGRQDGRLRRGRLSGMEYDLALRVGVDPTRIIFNGPYKREDDRLAEVSERLERIDFWSGRRDHDRRHALRGEDDRAKARAHVRDRPGRRQHPQRQADPPRQAAADAGGASERRPPRAGGRHSGRVSLVALPTGRRTGRKVFEACRAQRLAPAARSLREKNAFYHPERERP